LFDSPRHALFWNLPTDYPHVNGQPEWFVADPGRTYVFIDTTLGERMNANGRELVQDWQVDISAGSRSITIEEIDKAR
jgi:hypothetical protein